MKTILFLLILAHLATYGIDIAYEVWVPDYSASDAATCVGELNQLTFLGILVAAVAAMIYEFRDEFRGNR